MKIEVNMRRFKLVPFILLVILLPILLFVGSIRIFGNKIGVIIVVLLLIIVNVILHIDYKKQKLK